MCMVTLKEWVTIDCPTFCFNGHYRVDENKEDQEKVGMKARGEV